MSSNKRSEPCNDSSDDELDLKNTRAKKAFKREQCDSDAAFALELHKQEEDPNYLIPYPSDRQDDGTKNIFGDAKNGDTDSRLQESDVRATYAICCSNCT
jgi:stress response protein SCP2